MQNLPPMTGPPPTMQHQQHQQQHHQHQQPPPQHQQHQQHHRNQNHNYRGPTINQRAQMYTRPPVIVPPVEPTFEGPIITVFVGNISERAPDGMIKKILQTAGPVVNWKRVSAFGFCEYE